MPRYLSVRFCPETIFRRTLWVIAALVGASLFAAFLGVGLGHRRLMGLSDLVHLDREHNLPTLFSTIQLFSAGSLAWFVGGREAVFSMRWLWRFLGAGLCWIAIDEAVGIHELANELDIGRLHEISYFRFAWVVPAFAVVAVCAAVLLKLLLVLPRQTAAMLVVSGLIFIAGSLGMEMLSAPYYQPYGQEGWTYTMCYTLEETLEMLGPALFIRTALRYAIRKQDEAGQGVDAAPASVPR